MIMRKVVFYVILLLCICSSQLVISQKATTQVTQHIQQLAPTKAEIPEAVAGTRYQDKYLGAKRNVTRLENRKKSIRKPLKDTYTKMDFLGKKKIFNTKAYNAAMDKYNTAIANIDDEIYDAEDAMISIEFEAEMEEREKREKAEVWSFYRLREGCVPLTQVISKDPSKGRIIQNPYNVEKSFWKPYKIGKSNSIESNIEGIKYQLISIQYQLSRFERRVIDNIERDVIRIKRKVDYIYINTTE